MFCIDGCLYLIMLVYASYILIRYILSSKERRTKFFLMFYFLVIAVCICEIIYIVEIEIDPYKSFSHDLTVFEIL